MSTPGLLPCPVCHGSASIRQCRTETRAVCDTCGIAGPPVEYTPTELYALGTPAEDIWADGAAYAWNDMDARKLLASPDARVAVFVEEVQCLRNALAAGTVELKEAQREIAQLKRGQAAAEARAENAERAQAAAEARTGDAEGSRRGWLQAAAEVVIWRERAEKAERELQKWVPRSRGAASAADPGDRFALIEVD